jgi:coenzyme F420-0:L-glutamate ligase / coenzyme F420-1:gamma-L-glutamate ligase
MGKQVQLFEIPGLPLVEQGNNLGKLIVECCQRSRIPLVDDDIFVIAQRIVSKAEGSIVKLANVIPTNQAQELAQATGRDPNSVKFIWMKVLRSLKSRVSE